jgi:hypothetical protein
VAHHCEHSERAAHDQFSGLRTFRAGHQHGKDAGETVQPVDRMAGQLAKRTGKTQKPLQRQCDEGNGQGGG